jgi:hypothetical protein
VFANQIMKKTIETIQQHTMMIPVLTPYKQWFEEYRKERQIIEKYK